MMNLLLIGSDQVWSLEKIYYKYLKERPTDIRLFPAQNIFYGHYNQSIANKIFYRLGLSGIIKEINRQLINEVKEKKPAIIWVFKGMELLPSTLQWFKEQHIFLVNYNPDNPFIFTGYGSGNKNVKESIPLYDLHLTYNLEVRAKLESMGCKTGYLPFGFDLDDGLYQACAEEKEIVKLCFIGNADKERVGFIKALLKKGTPIDIYGHDWGNYINDPLASVFPAVYGDDYWKTLRRYRVQLNLMRIHNLQSHNMRSFEVPGVGGIMLAPNTIEHRMFFEDHQEAFFFNEVKDCVDRINELLGFSFSDAQSIRDAARKKSIERKYDYKSRTMDAINMIEGIKNKLSEF